MVRPPQLRASFESSDLIVDSFAGGGGASTGIEWALGRSPDIAINHDAQAIRMHGLNHPGTKHFQEDIWAVDPKEACGSNPVALLWASPDCRHFSRAKGTAPVKKEIRGLAWVVTRWAKAVRPRVIVLENVEEFQTWGPLLADGRPDRSRGGRTFRAWLAQLRNCGYEVQFRTLVAADFGAPTTRKRLYLIARCDGQPIIWPEATHGKGREFSWRPAYEIIDWAQPCPSIFERRRPLAEATLMRIAKGCDRYVFGNADPFIVPLTHQGDSRVHNIREPLRTVTGAHRGELALCEPFVVRHGHYSTITGAGLREGCGAGTFRGQRLSQPLATVCATNDKNLIAPIITKHYGGVVGHRVDKTLGTVTSRDHHSLTAGFFTKFYGTSIGASMQVPLPTVTANNKGGGHIAEVRAFLLRYNGTGVGADVQLPLPTITTKPRFGLVTVEGEDYALSDIGMRMLIPRELYRAQGFPDTYVIDGFTKEAQIRLCGNSVSPNVAKAIVAANLLGERAVAA